MKFWIAAAALSGISLAQAELVINEVDADNISTDTAEFIELYDGGSGNTALDDYVLVFFNGKPDTSYAAFDLDGYTTNSDGYFVLCGDSANVANCNLDVSPDSGLIQNGADAVALYQGVASDFPNGTAVTTSNLVDALVYGTSDADDAGLLVLMHDAQPQVDDTATESMQRCSNGSGGARNSASYLAAAPTPGATNSCSAAPVEDTFGACGETTQASFQLISSVQGSISDMSADASPLLGQTVIVEGIVTLDKQGGPLANGDSSYQYSGFWLQEETADSDGDDSTSEGIFVYDYKNAVNVGDKVRLRGTVVEYSQVTQIKSITDMTVCSTENALPAAVTVNLPLSSLTDLEALEGMLISNQQNLLVSDLFGAGYGLGNYGQFAVSSQLHFQGTEIASPGSVEALTADEARRLDTLLIDDGVSASYPTFIPFPDSTGLAADNPMRIGYRVPALSGVVHAYKTNFSVIPDTDLVIDPANPRTAAPVVAADANLVVVGMNVLNYFNGDGQGSGFPAPRGAPTADAFALQNDKIVAALVAMDADIIGLMELENDGFGEFSAIQTLVNELNAKQIAGDEYQFINPGVSQIGTDEITVGLLYRPAVVTPTGNTVILDSANSPLDSDGSALFIDDQNRPSLIQSFSMNDEVFTLSVNHLKSKGLACGEENEGDDGQGNCNISRTKAAQALMQFLATAPTGVAADNLMLLGDLNAYSQEDPMQVFYQNGLTNLKYTDKSTEEKPYSYSYNGMLGSLDHALASASVSEWVLSVDAWHINSVEDSLMDYLTEANGQDYKSVDNYAQADAYRSSDHDPIVVALRIPDADSGDDSNDDSNDPGDDAGNGADDNTDQNSDSGGALSLFWILPMFGLFFFRRRSVTSVVR